MERAELAASPSLKSALPPSPPAEKSAPTTPASLPALQLAGRTPDSITKDVASGSVRQVFNAGTPQELVISQRKLPTGQKNAAVHSEQAATRDTKNYSVGPPGPNKLTVTINRQEVTLEGRQSLEELAELAKTLKP